MDEVRRNLIGGAFVASWLYTTDLHLIRLRPDIEMILRAEI